jgi:acetyltransferase-like isoleucine patch superfamily enzyme
MIPALINNAYKLLTFIVIGSDKRACKIHRSAHVGFGSVLRNSKMGRYSYVGERARVVHANIGAFTSISHNVVIGGGAHPIQWVSTNPVFHSSRNALNKSFHNHVFEPFTSTHIGNDCWIGVNAIVIQGITLADGCILGAGSVLTKSTQPYEIWAGNPAKKIGYRFNEVTRERLLKSQWWNQSNILFLMLLY